VKKRPASLFMSGPEDSAPITEPGRSYIILLLLQTTRGPFKASASACVSLATHWCKKTMVINVYEYVLWWDELWFCLSSNEATMDLYQAFEEHLSNVMEHLYAFDLQRWETDTCGSTCVSAKEHCKHVYRMFWPLEKSSGSTTLT